MDFHLPELGEGIYEAELVHWLVQPGDKVSHGQILLEVMTDKAVVSVASPFDGTVQQLAAEAGAQIKVGEAILQYESSGQPRVDNGGARVAGGGASATPQSAEEPDRSTSVSAKMSRSSHVVAQSPVLRDDRAPTSAVPREARARAAPSVRRKAREMGVDLATVEGSGPGGRVLIKDLQTGGPRPTDRSDGRNGRGPEPESQPQLAPGSRIKVRGLRRAIAEAMSRAKRTIPHYSLIEECEVTELVRLRESLKESCQQRGVKLTYLPFIVRATVAALQEVPLVNAFLDEQAEEIVLHDRYHIGIATATSQGLMVPVIHDADRKDLLEIARDIDRLTHETRSGKARLEDVRGATFTITSIGSVGGLISTPIIHAPEVGILGAGRLVRKPVYDEHGQLRPADLVYLSFSFDHRVIDGDVGARFANAIIRRLQNPAAMLLP